VEYIPPEVGLLADPERPASFAAALARLLDTPWLRAAMAEQATAAAARFGVPAVIDAWQDVYARASRGEAAAVPSHTWSVSCA
jgi:hypothetical protein